VGAADVLALQRTVGNAAVARLVRQRQSDAALLQRAPEDGKQVKLDPRAIFDELHLQADFWGSDKDAGSRLDTAFHNNRPLTAADNGALVGKFQNALLTVGEQLPVSGADQNWGGETSRAVASFQSKNGIQPGGFEAGRKTLLALDAHLGGKPAPGPLPKPVPVPPQPTPVPGNEELEVVLDRIDVAYQKMVTRERDGVEALTRDLSNLDTPKPTDAQVLISFMLQVVGAGLYGFGEGALRPAIKKGLNEIDALSDAVKSDIDNANDKVFDGMNDKFLKDALSGGKGGNESRQDLLADYADEHLKAVTDAGFGAADKFEAEGKPTLRKGGTPEPPVLDPGAPAPTPGQPAPGQHDKRNQSGDPRVDAAFTLLDLVNATTGQAFDFHYDAGLRAWASKLAQAKEGVDSDNINDTNLEPLMAGSSVPQPPAGVLQVLLDLFAGPTETVVDARVDGLSRRVRKKLTGKTPAEAKLPLVADGSTGSRTMRIGVTEHGRVLNLTSSKSGTAFLEKRGKGDKVQGALNVADNVLKTKLPNIDNA
jgi:hypothetical protein